MLYYPKELFSINESITAANMARYDTQVNKELDAAERLYGHTKLQEISIRLKANKASSNPRDIYAILNEIDDEIKEEAK